MNREKKDGNTIDKIAEILKVMEELVVIIAKTEKFPVLFSVVQSLAYCFIFINELSADSFMLFLSYSIFQILKLFLY